MCACGNIETLKRLDDETGKKRSYIHRTYVQKRLDEQAGNRARACMDGIVRHNWAAHGHGYWSSVATLALVYESFHTTLHGLPK